MESSDLPNLDLKGSSQESDVTSATYNVLVGNVTVMTESPTLNGSVRQCDVINTDYDITAAIICALCFLFGILYTFFGYRCFRVVMFLTGFLFGSILVYEICQEESTFSPLVSAGISLGAGALCGLLCMLVQYVGLFLTGFNFGNCIAISGFIVLEQFVHLRTLWIPIGVTVGIGIVCAFSTLKFQKSGTILGTSVFGGILMISCIDYFIEHFILMEYIKDRFKARDSLPLCWYSWVILGCWPFCFLVGAIAQWKITGQGYDHREATPTRRCREYCVKRTPRPREKPKEAPHQSRYRHLYQARRVKGDVISQNYIQTMQTKLSPSLHRMTPVPTEPGLGEPESTNTTLTQIPEV
ncbi:transmembrane protein 198-like [Mya arenaria]|uniref:transmembrane protein 198-like n=1 Tax=Mya arenaria TaxID=6604 RepID=UPI0022DFCFC5|nr:transmembrane protein 198-like [Mya arenaria]XP_052810858.1 transmembrane protein 198-like [Mya arenaria]XP_052810867.1 transmembrane protein 198-like [Mya arenaria]XP_052810875.1 transmembrane protein 198-like [Mya arenaria]XP_052810885.1 transmembrane protein 198-like [Mya arenaria]